MRMTALFKPREICVEKLGGRVGRFACAGFPFVEICMRQFLWPSSEGTVSGEKHPSKLA
jgi:hypothetical protein